MKKILLIEDDEALREDLAEVLQLSNYQVISAADGKTGIEKSIQEKPDLIICDVVMPGLDGYGVIHVLSRHPDTFSIPFIFLTGKNDPADLRKGMDLGADDYLIKPFRPDELGARAAGQGHVSDLAELLRLGARKGGDGGAGEGLGEHALGDVLGQGDARGSEDGHSHTPFGLSAEQRADCLQPFAFGGSRGCALAGHVVAVLLAVGGPLGETLGLLGQGLLVGAGQEQLDVVGVGDAVRAGDLESQRVAAGVVEFGLEVGDPALLREAEHQPGHPRRRGVEHVKSVPAVAHERRRRLERGTKPALGQRARPNDHHRLDRTRDRIGDRGVGLTQVVDGKLEEEDFA